MIRSSGNAAIAFSPDTTKIVVADDYHLQPNEANRHSLGVWSLHTGERLQTLRDTRQELITKL
ncbi:MAG TPA: hypothetical protein PLX97_12735, partial [Gemmatales bacterium]|nr:hypothetical protein [Gemmatales bacterium]